MTTANEAALAAIDAAGGDVTKVPLDRAEEVLLHRHEKIIAAGLATFVEVGNSLAAIRSGKLYRQTHSTFEAYCKDRWGMGDRHARNVINAAEVGTMVPVENERQARELGGLEPDQAREVYARAVENSTGNPTAKSIRKARQEIAPRPLPLPQMSKRNLSIYTDPNRFINVMTTYGSNGGDLTRNQMEGLDWERLDRDAVPGYIANVDSTIRVLKKIRAKLTAVTE